MIVSTADIQRAAFRFYTKSGFKRVRSEIAEAMTVKQAGGGLLRHYFEKGTLSYTQLHLSVQSSCAFSRAATRSINNCVLAGNTRVAGHTA